MASTVLPPKPKPAIEREEKRPSTGGGGFGDLPPQNGDGGGESGQPDPGVLAVQRYKLGIWIGFGGIVMVFAAFTSALVVRKGLSDDWRAFELPDVLWLGTLILLASSVTVEKARRAMQVGLEKGLRRWLGATALFGAAFLASQYAGWRELAAQGVYVTSNPSSSFFYLLTAAHGLHLLGGMMAMTYVVWRVWRSRIWVTRDAAVEGAALYWHLMDGLWVYLFALILVGG